MADRKHLPMFGGGPVYVGIIIMVTTAAVFLGQCETFEKGRIEFLKIPFFVLGILFIILGACLWFAAVFRSKIDDGITGNRLVTTGVYSLCRNPIYSAFMFFCTGALMISGNLFFLPIFFFYWCFMTVLMKGTEEKWLFKLYGTEYSNYCKRVNRCIPWFKNV